MRIFILFFIMLTTLISAKSIGKVTAIRGDVKITRGVALYQAHIDLEIEEKDTFFTGRRGAMQITFVDNTVITLGRNTVFKVEEYLYAPKTDESKAKYKFQKGFVKSITGRIGKIAPKKFKIKTKNSTIGIRGTEYVIKLCKQDDCTQTVSRNDPEAKLHAVVLEGAITLTTDEEVQILMAMGEYGTATPETLVIEEEVTPPVGFLNQEETQKFNVTLPQKTEARAQRAFSGTDTSDRRIQKAKSTVRLPADRATDQQSVRSSHR